MINLLMRSCLSYFQLLRPKQWLKNLILLFPPLFAGILFSPSIFQGTLLPLLAFCLISSANYALNDVFDADRDARHPTKKYRPVPSGRVSKQAAIVMSCCLFAVALVCAISVSRTFTAILLAYTLLMGSYTFWFKHIVLLDIFCIAVGFLLRLAAGGSIAAVPVSSWLFLSVFFVAVFLSSGKRLSEQLVLDSEASSHRKTLDQYPDGMLEALMLMTGTSAMLTYTLYTVRHPPLMYTVPLCFLGLARYLLRIKQGHSGDPTEALLYDKVLLGIGLLWLVAVVAWKI